VPGEFTAPLQKTLTRAPSAERKHALDLDRSSWPSAPVPPSRRMPQGKGLAGRGKLALPVETPAYDPYFAHTNASLTNPQSSYERMSRVLNNPMFSQKIDSIDFVDAGDILVRMAAIPAQAQVTNQSGHDDLIVHAAILLVHSVSPDQFTFKRIEMKEASSNYNAIGFSEKYRMALNPSETTETKPDDFLKHGHTFKIRIAGTGKALMSDKLVTRRRFARAFSDEMKFVRNHRPIYGSGVDGQYNCNTFVANVLLRACNVAGGDAELGFGAERQPDAAGAMRA